MDADRFSDLSRQDYNRIPVFRDVLADLDTPVSAYLKLADAPYSFLLESVEGGEKWARYSFIGLPCRTRLEIRGHSVCLCDGDAVEDLGEFDDPLSAVEQLRDRFRVPELDNMPPFAGGLVGYFGYDTVRYVEKRLANSCPADDAGSPDVLLLLSEDVVVFDNLTGKVRLLTHADPSEPEAYEQACRRLDEMQDKLTRPLSQVALSLAPDGGSSLSESDFRSGFGEQAFMESVEKVREYILAGDAMQVVISQRMSVPFKGRPFDFYRALRHLNPSPYLYYLNLGDQHVAGSSPEILARYDRGEITVRPLAGTRRRGHDEIEDLALEKELLSDPKELAEHLMLIDLGRNDVGRIATTGSVELTERMSIERYSHVMHIVSSVRGQAQPGMNAIDVLRATLPAGTLSGAPKVRAMEIIDELEPVKRGVYGGAVGYIGWTGNMDTAIAIRTAVIRDGALYIQAGAGIVADSQPRLEWKETLNKARAIFRAAAMVPEA